MMQKAITEEQIISYLRAHPDSRRAFIAMHLGYHRKDVPAELDRLLQKMRKAGTIVTGSGGYWSLAKRK